MNAPLRRIRVILTLLALIGAAGSALSLPQRPASSVGLNHDALGRVIVQTAYQSSAQSAAEVCYEFEWERRTFLSLLPMTLPA